MSLVTLVGPEPFPETADAGPLPFVERLAADALRHRAVRHPYLHALAEGKVPDLRWAIADFARQYLGYQKVLPQCLLAVLSRLDRAAHRQELVETMADEPSHEERFERFARALGVRPGVEADPVVCWREMFVSLLTHGSPAEAVGALGLGTDNIVATVYRPIVAGIGRLPDLDPRDREFFELHATVAEQRQGALQEIAADFALTLRGRWDLRRGMLKALTLRAGFWDWMLERARGVR